MTKQQHARPTAREQLNQALDRMKRLTNADDLTIYKTPGGYWHVTDSTFNMILNAPTARILTLCIDAYVDGYTQAKPTAPDIW